MILVQKGRYAFASRQQRSFHMFIGLCMTFFEMQNRSNTEVHVSNCPCKITEQINTLVSGKQREQYHWVRNGTGS
jgi:hypothetical protein